MYYATEHIYIYMYRYNHTQLKTTLVDCVSLAASVYYIYTATTYRAKAVLCCLMESVFYVSVCCVTSGLFMFATTDYYCLFLYIYLPCSCFFSSTLPFAVFSLFYYLL